jgi:hypothetical protein
MVLALYVGIIRYLKFYIQTGAASPLEGNGCNSCIFLLLFAYKLPILRHSKPILIRHVKKDYPYCIVCDDFAGLVFPAPNPGADLHR